jgi:hypothetical protein
MDADGAKMGDEDGKAGQALIHHTRGIMDKEALELQYGKVWTKDELLADFEVIGFSAPYVLVRRLSDRKEGTMMFTHNPRFYFDFQ